MVVAHDLTEESQSEAKGFAYGELGEIHSLLGNYEQAISCMEHQLKAARCLVILGLLFWFKILRQQSLSTENPKRVA